MSEVVYRCYLAVVALLALHGAHRLILWAAWARRRAPVAVDRGETPLVTVQLPVYNERDVVARLVDAVAALDWPADRLEVQLLDDSTDDTGQAAAGALARARAAGIDAVWIRRPDRAGFKAGALAYGLGLARGRHVAVFDADFVPSPDFLRVTVPHLLAGAGMVQVRWGHLNRNASALTRAEAALLDGHFVVEQPARQAMGAWFNFNGTGGVWDRAAIDAGGGWQHDTLTEDLDLSYRSLMAGARFVYLDGALVPAELPDTMPAFLAQQARWARGSLQTARKLLPRIWRARAPLHVKSEATAHLTANLAWPLGVVVAVLLPVVVLTRGAAGTGSLPLDLLGLTLSVAGNAAFYRAGGAPWRDLPLALALGVGMAPAQAVAALQGLGGPVGEFVRTPKNGGGAGSYRASPGRAPVEAALAALHLGVAAWALLHGHLAPLPFLLWFGLGFAWVASGRFGAPAASPALPRLLPSDPALTGK